MNPLLLGLGILLGGAAIGVGTAAIVIHISGKITKSKIREELIRKRLSGAFETISKTAGHVKLDSLDDNTTVDVDGDSVAWNVREGTIIHV